VRNRAELLPQLEPILRARSTKEWLKRLGAANVPHARVWDYAQLFAQEQIAVRNMKVTVRDPSGNPVDLIGSPLHIAGAASAPMYMPPVLGGQSREVLRHLLGLTETQIDALRSAKIV